MIKGIGLENFKAFKNQAYIDFKKINVFLGPNSSGKSSYLKGLLTLKNTMSNQEAEPALRLSDRIGDFTSLVYGNDPNGKITYTIHFDLKKGEPVRSNLGKVGKEMGFAATGLGFGAAALGFGIGGVAALILVLLSQATKGSASINDRTETLYKELQKFEVKGLERIVFSVIQDSPKTPNKVDFFKVFFLDGDVYEIHPNGKSHQIIYNGIPVLHQLLAPYKFFARFKEQDIWEDSADKLENLSLLALALSFIEQDLKNFTEKMIHIEPFRHEPKRSELVTDFNFGSVGSKGENMLTSFIGLTKTKLQDEINRWMNEFHLAESVEVEELGNNNFSLRIKNKNTGITSNIVDVGVGTSQLLPIIVESVISAPNSVLLIEEPETHIHPNAQAKLAELFVESSQKFDKRFFVETHSMYLIMQLQILAAKKLLKPEEVGIYYFKQDENGSHVIDLQLNEKGQFDVEFPTGFFDVAYEMTKILLRHM